MYSQPLTDAIAEAEQLVAAAPFIESEADLLEGLQYLAGCIAGCTHLAFDYERDHPFMQSGTGPFTKMGLDNPDTLYFGTRVQPGHEYVVTGKRGTTTDLSFQMLGGEYTDDNVPDSQAAFDDRELDIAADGTFEWRVTPNSPSQLVVREVYNDWSAQRGYISIARTDTAGTAPPPLTRAMIEKRYAVAGKQLVQRVKTWLQFPQWFYNTLPVNTMVAPRLTPGGLATQYSSVGHFDLAPEQALVITLPVTDAPVPRLPARQPLVHLAGLHQPPDIAERHSGTSGSGRQDPDRGRRRQPRRDELGGDTRARQGLSAVPLAAAVARADRGRRPDRRTGRPRQGRGRAAVLRVEQDLRRRLARADRAAPEADRRQDGG